jgi:hypothetical protein
MPDLAPDVAALPDVVLPDPEVPDAELPLAGLDGSVAPAPVAFLAGSVAGDFEGSEPVLPDPVVPDCPDVPAADP